MAYLVNKRGHWYVYWRDGGRGSPLRCQRVGTNKREAEKLKTLIEARHIEGRVGSDVVLPRITFGEFADRWWAGRSKRPGTMDRERRLLDNYLLSEFGTTLLYEITPDQVAAFGAKLTRQSGWTARRAQGLIKTMLQQAQQWGYLRKNPAWDIPLPEKPHRELRPPSVEDVCLLIRDFSEAHKALVFTDALTGLGGARSSR